MALEIPKTIGRYQVERLLGAGAMGAVYLGRDPSLGRLVAIKTLRDLNLDPPTVERYIERFKNEARAAGRLEHPSIVHVYDVGEDAEAGPFLVFEYVRGASLREVIRAQGPPSPNRLAEIATQMGEALDVAHHAGIIHRDIKPDNLLVAEDGRVKLADFGIARVPDAALTRDGQFLGTPCYSAPETLRAGTYSPRSDVFSFAAVLYEVITGIRAFPGDDAVAVAHKVAHEEPARPSVVAKGIVVPAAVDRVIMRGLSKEPGERPASAGDLARELVRALKEANLVDASAEFASRPVVVPRSVGFIALVMGGIAFGLAAVFVFGEGSLGAASGDDGGVAPSLTDFDDDDGARGRARSDDGGKVTVRDAGPPADAGAAPPDGGRTPIPLDKHGREEAAKDAIQRAERLLGESRWEEARRALEEAKALDAANDDIARVEALLPAPPGP